MTTRSSFSKDTSPRVVFKFGGSSVGAVDRFRTVVELVRRATEEGRVVAVVSAQGKVTRRLIAGIESFSAQPDHRESVIRSLVQDLRDRHMDQARAVLSSEQQAAYSSLVDDRLDGLRRTFHKAEGTRISPSARDAILATGEQLSVPMVALALRDAGLNAPHCAATELVVTDDSFGEANVLFEETAARIREWYRRQPPEAVLVVAGFLGATVDGTVTTLGLEGSDYSAALFARILGAHCLIRYTDVDGLYTDDPKTNESAERIDRLSMKEAYARTVSGQMGLHPKTLRPLVEADIPVQVRSILNPEGPGTDIIPDGVENVRQAPSVEGVASAENS